MQRKAQKKSVNLEAVRQGASASLNGESGGAGVVEFWLIWEMRARKEKRTQAIIVSK